jgi:hypothetical protein
MTALAKNIPAKPLPNPARYPKLDPTRYPKRRGTGPTAAEVERDMDRMPHLADDKRFEDDQTIAHECHDMRKMKVAADHLLRIPDALECFHLLCSGRYALWDLAGPAVLHHAHPATIASMTIATLGFSKTNIADMRGMLAAGKIGRLSLVCSHYFKGTNTEIWDGAAAMPAEFPTTVRFASVRNHAKIAAIQLTDGRTITIESSANLHSCRNLEFITVYGHPALYEFHTAWINELFELKGVHRDRR